MDSASSSSSPLNQPHLSSSWFSLRGDVYEGKNPDKAKGSSRGLEDDGERDGECTNDCCLLCSGLRIVSLPVLWKARETKSCGADLERCWTDIMSVW